MLVMSQSNCVPTLYRQSKNLRLDVPNGSTTLIHCCLRLIDNLLIEGVRLFLLRRSEENFSCFLPLISAEN